MHFIKRLIILILTYEARLVLWRHAPDVVAVSGNIGKTTTKEAIYAVLSAHMDAGKSEKSYNSEVGVPLAILRSTSAWRNPLQWITVLVRGVALLFASRYPKLLVLEVGADHPGDIAHIGRWLRPHTTVLTGVPSVPVHVEFFGSPEALRAEKCSMLRYMRPGGLVVVNGDDAELVAACRAARGAAGRLITYGLESSNDIQGSHQDIEYARDIPRGVRFRINHEGSSVPVTVSGVLGRAPLYASLAAAAVAREYGVSLHDVAEALSSWLVLPGRMRLLPGVRGSIIIDDTYNASPEATLAALDALEHVRATRRVAILGDMLELGKWSAETHREVGKRAAGCADIFITVGFRMRKAAEAALDAGMDEYHIQQYEHFESERAGRELEKELAPGDVVLIKGSQSMRMERAVKEIMAEPLRARELLVRQSAEWLAR